LVEPILHHTTDEIKKIIVAYMALPRAIFASKPKESVILGGTAKHSKANVTKKVKIKVISKKTTQWFSL